jgi:hypothetical protein
MYTGQTILAAFESIEENIYQKHILYVYCMHAVSLTPHAQRSNASSGLAAIKGNIYQNIYVQYILYTHVASLTSHAQWTNDSRGLGSHYREYLSKTYSYVCELSFPTTTKLYRFKGAT